MQMCEPMGRANPFHSRENKKLLKLHPMWKLDPRREVPDPRREVLLYCFFLLNVLSLV